MEKDLQVIIITVALFTLFLILLTVSLLLPTRVSVIGKAYGQVVYSQVQMLFLVP